MQIFHNRSNTIRPARSFGTTPWDRSTALVLLFALFGVVLPAASVLWFMNDAARSQAAAARQSVVDAYRGQLRLLRDSVDEYWKAKSAELRNILGATPSAEFKRITTMHLADSVIVLDRNGGVAYPSPAIPTVTGAIPVRQDWNAAQALELHGDWSGAAAAYGRIGSLERNRPLIIRAMQSQVRSLTRAGDNGNAIRVIQQFFLHDFFAQPAATIAADPAGLSVAADELLLGLHLLSPADRRRGTMLAGMLKILDGDLPISSSQRLFLMREAQLLPEKPTFATFDAEQLAAQFLESDQLRSSGPGLQATSIPGVWKLAVKQPSSDRIALFRTATVLAATHIVLDPQATASIQFNLIPPGWATAEGDTHEEVAAGSMLTGWQVGFALVDTKLMEAESQRRMRTYVWGGYMVVSVMVVVGLLLGSFFQRQLVLSRLKTDLVAAVSHELKTPLASMRLLVDSLLGDVEHGAADHDKTRDYLRLVAGENQRLTRLIENFLAFSRIERKKQRLEFTDTKPFAIIETALVSIRERLQASGVQLNISIQPNLPILHADADALVTVLINLLENADKYTPHDNERERKISLSAFSQDGKIYFAIADRGIGIAPADQKRIFRKFYQVDQRLARSTGGCGLGLSIVDHIVRAHGGTVTVVSTLGEGSTFSVILPALAASRVNAEETATA